MHVKFDSTPWVCPIGCIPTYWTETPTCDFTPLPHPCPTLLTSLPHPCPTLLTSLPHPCPTLLTSLPHPTDVSRHCRTPADVSRHCHTSADVSCHCHTPADVSRHCHTPAPPCFTLPHPPACRFHGKPPSKNKQEQRQKKYLEEQAVARATSSENPSAGESRAKPACSSTQRLQASVGTLGARQQRASLHAAARKQVSISGLDVFWSWQLAYLLLMPVARNKACRHTWVLWEFCVLCMQQGDGLERHACGVMSIVLTLALPTLMHV
jgi:hypothetical protein